MPLGQQRLLAEKLLQQLAEATQQDASALWEIAMTAKTAPPSFESSEEGRSFWEAFEALRAKEAEELSRVVGIHG